MWIGRNGIFNVTDQNNFLFNKISDKNKFKNESM